MIRTTYVAILVVVILATVWFGAQAFRYASTTP